MVRPDTAGVLLASTSRYRRTLLERLLPEFEVMAPDVDEAVVADESPSARAARLAMLKAEAGVEHANDRVVIGSDQVASLSGRVLRKPGSHTRAARQLADCVGRTVDFHTSVCVIAPGQRDQHTDHTRVVFRETSDALREAYLKREQPYDCAGSFKSEALGIALMSRIDNEDPTALQGLPLIWLADCLQRFGVEIL